MSYRHHRIRMERVLNRQGEVYGHGWYCRTCGECSETFPTRLRAWWASVYYWRHGICRGPRA